MSEFTEVYFLRSNNNRDAVNLLKKAKVEGFVYPARDGWTAFVANSTPLYHFSEALRKDNEGILLYFTNAEDYGWGFDVCVKNEMVCSYGCGLNEDIDSEEFYNIHRKIEKNSFEKLIDEDNIFCLLNKYFDENEVLENISDVHDFTDNLKLYFSEWISYHYAELDSRSGCDASFQYGEYDNLQLVKVDKA